MVALAGLPLIVFAFALCHLLARARAHAHQGRVRHRIPDPPPAARRQAPHPRDPLGRLAAAPGWSSATPSSRCRSSAGSAASLVFFAWGTALAFLSFPLWGLFVDGGGTLFGADVGYAPSAIVHLAAGTGALYAAPWLARGVAAVQVAMARLLLEPGERERLSARVDTLEETRAGMVAAADAERRRIERDLHDGAQQRLVALAMTLGRAKATEDPVLTKTLVGEAHGEAKEALVELRNLARGIHPAVLTDRGLDAAVSALAARCPIPVAVDVDLPHRATRRARRSPTSSSPRR